MAEQREIESDKRVSEVIKDLLLTTLPAELRAAAPELADRVAEHPEITPHLTKRWRETSEGERNIIAREVALIARDLLLGAGSLTQSGGEHLH